MKRYLPYLLAFMLMTGGCSHKPSPAPVSTKPDWTSGSSSRYGSRQYLTAVGVGTSQRQAEDAARRELAGIFKVRILATTLDWMKSETLPGQKETFAQKIETMTSTSVDQVLEGCSIAEHWEDRERGTFYALAILDRERSAGILRERIRKLDGEVEALNSVQDDRSPLSGLREAIHAAEAIQKRDLLNSELAVASTDGNGIPAPYSYGKAAATINRILSSVKIGVEVNGDSNGAIRLALVEGLSRGGFQVMTDKNSTDILVKGSVNDRPLELSGTPWQWHTATLLGEIVDVKKGAYLGTLREESREGAKDEITARDRTLRDLADKVTDGIKRELIKSLGNSR